ncbi:unnamed protein product [Calypogeia fissa]
MDTFDTTRILGDDGKALSPRGAQIVRNFLDVNRRKTVKKVAPSSQPNHVDVAVDTMDLIELTGDDDDTDYDALEEAQRQLDMEMEEHDGKKTITLEDYLELVKKSAGRIGLRAQLLHELSLGDDVNMGIPDSELPSLLPVEKMGTELLTRHGESQSKDQETNKAIPIYKGAMRATSLVIKRLRRMAGLMHVEQQNMDLKDVYAWLQRLGYLATSSGKVVPSRVGSSGGRSSIYNFTGEKIDWRLPSSPAQALEMAQADLRDRLAFLYEEQNQIQNRKEQLEAAKRIVGKKLSKTQVQRLSKHMQNLKNLEVRYEELGGKIVQNLEDVATLETQFKKLSEKDEAESPGKRKKQKKKETKAEKKAAPRVKASPPSEPSSEDEDSDEGKEKQITKTVPVTKKQKKRVEEIEPKESSEEDDSDGSEKGRTKRKRSRIEKGDRGENDAAEKGWSRNTTSAEDIPSLRMLDDYPKEPVKEKKVRKSSVREKSAMVFKQQKDDSWSRMSGLRAEAENSLLEEKAKVSDLEKKLALQLKVPKEHIVTNDKAVQTHHSELLALMESMLDAINEEDPGGTDSSAAKLKRLLRENKRMRAQLRFWRSRNWVESTIGARQSRYGSRGRSKTGTPLPPSIMLDSASDDDLSIYFDPIRPPSIPSQRPLSVGSSSSRSIQGRELGTGTTSVPSSSSQPLNYEGLQQNTPSNPGAFSPLKSTNADILLDTLQMESNIALSRSRNIAGILSPTQASMNKSLNLKRSTQGLQPRSSQQGTNSARHQLKAVPPVLLEPLNAELLTKAHQRNTQSPPRIPQPSSSRLSSKNLQPIPAEVLNLALRSKSKSPLNQGTKAPSSRTIIPSLSIGFSERFSPSKALSATSRMSKTSRSLRPLQSEPSTSRAHMQMSTSEQPIQDTKSDIKDTLSSSGSLQSLQSPPDLEPIEHEAESIVSPRNNVRNDIRSDGRNMSRNNSPRLTQPLVSSPQSQEGQGALNNSSGTSPRSSGTRVATQNRRSHPSPNSQRQPFAENGLMIVGRKSNKE